MSNARYMEQVLEESFLDYSAFVVQRRSTPDARDGMKFTQRQILHAQYQDKLDCKHPRKKSQKSVAAAMSFSYVHGDSACYGQITRMGNPLASRYMFQDFKGNSGTAMSSDDYAAYRYTETMLNALGLKCFEHIDHNTLSEKDWSPTYDEGGFFPTVLPSIGYYNICNGQFGSIGSTMVSSIPQFNLKEVNDVICKLIDDPEVEFVLLPDFASGGTLLNPKTVLSSLSAGRGKSALVRGTVKTNVKGGFLEIIELPYGVYTETICKELAKAIDKPDCPFTEYKDLSDAKPCVRIYGKDLEKLEKWLYKNTSTQQHFTIIMNMLDNGKTPKLFSLRDALLAHINHASLMYRRQFEYALQKLQTREEIIRGLLRAHSIINEIIPVIQASKGRTGAIMELQNVFQFTQLQAEAIVDLRLHRLSGIDVTALQEELEDNLKEQENLSNILNNSEIFNQHLKAEYEEVGRRFGDKRRTKIHPGDEWETGQDGSQPTKDFWVVERPTDYFATYSEEEIGDNEEWVIKISPSDDLVFITNKARGFVRKGSDILLGAREWGEILKLNKGENICCVMKCDLLDQVEYVVCTDKTGDKYTLHKSFILTGASLRGKKLVSGDYDLIEITPTRSMTQYPKLK